MDFNTSVTLLISASKAASFLAATFNASCSFFKLINDYDTNSQHAHTLHDDCNLWRDVVIAGLIVCFFIRGRSHTAGASRFGQGTVYHRWARS